MSPPPARRGGGAPGEWTAPPRGPVEEGHAGPHPRDVHPIAQPPPQAGIQRGERQGADQDVGGSAVEVLGRAERRGLDPQRQVADIATLAAPEQPTAREAPPSGQPPYVNGVARLDAERALHAREVLHDEPVTDAEVDDCFFRMLEPHEIAAGMAFPRDYIWQGTKHDRIRMAGNAVTPPAARDLIAAVVDSLEAAT